MVTRYASALPTASPVRGAAHPRRAGLAQPATPAPHAVLASRPSFKQQMLLAREEAIVDVVADRVLSRAVAERTGVRHQSPQLLYLERGVARWHLSHGEITTEAVRRRLTGTPDRT